MSQRPENKPAKKAAPKSVRKRRKKPRKIKISGWQSVSLALGIIASIIFIYSKSSGTSSDSGDPVPSIGSRIYAVDLSHHNAGDINWEELRVLVDTRGNTVRETEDASDSFKVGVAFLKASEGVSSKDNRFRERWTALEDSGIRRGAYHFFISTKSGKAQAENFINAVGELRHSDLPPVLDIESISKRCSEKEMNERAVEWIKAIEEHYDRKPIIYTYESFLSRLSEEIRNNYQIWIAHYRTDSPVFKDWQYWQFTDKAVVHGIPGYVDPSVIK